MPLDIPFMACVRTPLVPASLIGHRDTSADVTTNISGFDRAQALCESFYRVSAHVQPRAPGLSCSRQQLIWWTIRCAKCHEVCHFPYASLHQEGMGWNRYCGDVRRRVCTEFAGRETVLLFMARQLNDDVQLRGYSIQQGVTLILTVCLKGVFLRGNTCLARVKFRYTKMQWNCSHIR